MAAKQLARFTKCFTNKPFNNFERQDSRTSFQSCKYLVLKWSLCYVYNDIFPLKIYTLQTQVAFSWFALGFVVSSHVQKLAGKWLGYIKLPQCVNVCAWFLRWTGIPNNIITEDELKIQILNLVARKVYKRYQIISGSWSV